MKKIDDEFIKKYNPNNEEKINLLFNTLIKNNIRVSSYKDSDNYNFSEMFYLSDLKLKEVLPEIINYSTDLGKGIISPDESLIVTKIPHFFSKILNINYEALYKIKYCITNNTYTFRQLVFVGSSIFFYYNNKDYHNLFVNFNDVKDKYFEDSTKNNINIIIPKDINNYKIKEYEIFKINNKLILINPIIENG